MSNDRRFAVIGTYLNPLEAHISRALIVSQGIPAVLSNEHHVWANWQLSLALGGVRLLVPIERVSDANELFALMNSGQLEDALNRQWELPTPVCNKCGSAQLEEVHCRGSISSALLALFFGVPVIPLPKKKVCAKCG
jgi:hypothetical protein